MQESLKLARLSNKRKAEALKVYAERIGDLRSRLRQVRDSNNQLKNKLTESRMKLSEVSESNNKLKNKLAASRMRP